MQRNFIETKRFLQSQFPELRDEDITGSNYPPPPIIELISKILSGLQLAGIAFFVVGPTAIFRMFGMPGAPAWYEGVSKNAVQIAIVLYLILPQMISKYMVTGAFEIILDDDIVIYSKLAMRRFPQRGELITSLVDAGLKLVQKA
mmetsp:Transcript_598/g.1691  ORF Transcript_598/g.1691 Transcript_598/m.1691 type:complete len:145 (-) Transcript_598:773-1207(-)